MTHQLMLHSGNIYGQKRRFGHWNAACVSGDNQQTRIASGVNMSRTATYQPLSTEHLLRDQLLRNVREGYRTRNGIAFRSFITFLVAGAAICFVMGSTDSIPHWISNIEAFWQADILPLAATKLYTLCADGVARLFN